MVPSRSTKEFRSVSSRKIFRRSIQLTSVNQYINSRPLSRSIGAYRGTQTGEIQDIPPTNRQIKLAVMHLDRVVNGKIVEHRGLANELDFMRQLGVVLAPK
jgi:hypothetical protein